MGDRHDAGQFTWAVREAGWWGGVKHRSGQVRQLRKADAVRGGREKIKGE